MWVCPCVWVSFICLKQNPHFIAVNNVFFFIDSPSMSPITFCLSLSLLPMMALDEENQINSVLWMKWIETELICMHEQLLQSNYAYQSRSSCSTGLWPSKGFLWQDIVERTRQHTHSLTHKLMCMYPHLHLRSAHTLGLSVTISHPLLSTLSQLSLRFDTGSPVSSLVLVRDVLSLEQKQTWQAVTNQLIRRGICQ